MELFDDEFTKFIEKYATDDPVKLRLRHASDGPVVAEAINQIDLRRKAANKFVDADGRSLQPKWLPAKVSVEQSTSAPIARFHASLMPPQPRILDMTAGMGVDDAAFADLPGAQVTSIEIDERLAHFARLNYADRSNIRVVHADSVEWLKASDERFDVIFIDPARRSADGDRVIDIRQCTPDVTEILPLMLEHSPRIFIKLSPMLDIAATVAQLPGTSRVFIVEERGECREILIEVSAEHDASEPVLIEVVTPTVRMSFTREEEAEAEPIYAAPKLGMMLYEPSVATMKAGPYNILCRRYGVAALHPNTHLYVSDSLAEGFPGKAYRIEAVVPYASGEMKRFARRWPEASVAVRNFPITAAALRDKLRTRESSTRRVFGVTVKGGDKVLIVADATSAPRS